MRGLPRPLRLCWCSALFASPLSAAVVCYTPTANSAYVICLSSMFIHRLSFIKPALIILRCLHIVMNKVRLAAVGMPAHNQKPRPRCMRHQRLTDGGEVFNLRLLTISFMVISTNIWYAKVVKKLPHLLKCSSFVLFYFVTHCLSFAVGRRPDGCCWRLDLVSMDEQQQRRRGFCC